MKEINSLQFAMAVENSIHHEIETIAQNAPVELVPILEILLTIHTEFTLLLNRAQQINGAVEQYPQVEMALVAGVEERWQQAIAQLPAVSTEKIGHLTLFWMIYTLIDKSAQYYQQAALNTPYPATQLFMSSLAQVKHSLRRRVSAVLRVMNNDVWAEIGFAPFVLSKD